MHLTIKERVELVLMSGADGVCYYYLNCFICFGALFMAQNVCYYYLNCFICFGALFMAQNVCYYYLNCFICFGALFMAHPVEWEKVEQTEIIYLSLIRNGRPLVSGYPPLPRDGGTA